ncbi:alginate O-acetyltransferase AlgX-related protein [Pusillimonas sp.]|uniref:alginate O-acetyltransferase AlgX-related protein n=1 Tax=Pusillimonas sp. TaxID=3040095 RepID=UPI0029A3E098|nr:cell division protein FtsQ [Pusillimonas sp.]MDX3895528.1 cell division protein FtsQ [Pusillimonas sp.]
MALADPVQSFNLPSRWARNVAGVIFLTILLAGAASAAWTTATGRIKASAWTREQFMQGETTRELTGELARAPLPSSLADAERAASWLIAGSLGPRVRQGCGQWLFLVDELEVHPEGMHNARRRLEAVVRLRDRLRRQDIELVVATVPDKSRVQSEQLCGIYRPASSADRLSDWEKGLAQRGVRHASLLAPLEALKLQGKDQPFLRTDTHWTEAGAAAAAQTIAEAVGQSGVALTPHQRYAMQKGEARDRMGDLVRLAGIDWLPPVLQPAPDRVAAMRFSVDTIAEPSVDLDDAADDLFGDANLPSVALIGTSYSGISSFVSYLEAALGTPVPDFAQDGGDFWLAGKTYLEGSEFRETPPRIVIWEIPERVLQMPIVADEAAWMQALETPGGHAGSSVDAARQKM